MKMRRFWVAAMAALFVATTPAMAQMQTVDPNNAIDRDLQPGYQQDYQPQPSVEPVEPTYQDQPVPVDPAPEYSTQQQQGEPRVADQLDIAPPSAMPGAAEQARAAASTYRRDDLIGAAEGVFGKGAAGLAGIIEDILREQGEPNAYIAGREASGAFIVGLRYGSGIMHHAIEGQRPVYWTGPSVGFDVGGDAANVFVLVYNLYDSQELYKRFPAGEGRVYFVGGFSASYMRRGDVVLIPVRLGVGWRLGVNAGYMNFTEKSRWLPF